MVMSSADKYLPLVGRYAGGDMSVCHFIPMSTSVIDTLQGLISLQKAIHWSHPTASGFLLSPQQL